MLEIRRPTSAQISARFAYLMGMYGENYWRMVRCLGPDALDVGHYRSSVGDGLDLALELIERHPYTLELRLSYLFEDERSGAPDPSAREASLRRSSARMRSSSRRWLKGLVM